jgi:hypothetical protein
MRSSECTILIPCFAQSISKPWLELGIFVCCDIMPGCAELVLLPTDQLHAPWAESLRARAWRERSQFLNSLGHGCAV